MVAGEVPFDIVIKSINILLLRVVYSTGSTQIAR